MVQILISITIIDKQNGRQSVVESFKILLGKEQGQDVLQAGYGLGQEDIYKKIENH
jgi:hypothetical protein